MLRWLALLLALLPLQPASAQVTQAQLARVGFQDRRGATLPKDIVVEDLKRGSLTLAQAGEGKPVLLLLVDYTCQTLCGITTAAVAQALAGVPLRIGQDYRVLIVGLDAKDGRAAASAFRDARLAESPVIAAMDFLRGSATTVEALSAAIGMTVAYDRARDQYAHPAGLVVATPDLRVSRTLDAMALTPLDLRLAFTEAGQGRTGSLADRLILTCYGWDAAKGIYTLQVRRLLMAGGMTTALVVALLLVSLLVRERRSLATDRGGGHE